MQLRYSGERYLPEAPGKAIHYEHLHRYAFAKYFAKGKRVIDIACGEGYGSYLLAEVAETVLGLDVDGATIAHAYNKYKNRNLKFLQCSMTELSFKTQECFDLAVCMEGIEHTKKQHRVIEQISKVLNKDGVLIISTPNMIVSKNKGENTNAFHEKELNRKELEDLLSGYFKNLAFFGQKVNVGSHVWQLQKNEGITVNDYIKLEKNEYKFISKQEEVPDFFIVMATNSFLDLRNNFLLKDIGCDLEMLDLELDHLKNKVYNLNAKVTQMEQSTSWKITSFLRKFKNYITKK